MPLKVRCPGCNKKVRIADADAGRPAICPACGLRFDTPAAPLLGPLHPGNAAPPVTSPAPALPPMVAGAVAAGSAQGSAGVAPDDDDDLVDFSVDRTAVSASGASPPPLPARAPVNAVGVPFSRLAAPANPAPSPEDMRAVLAARRTIHPVVWFAAGLVGCMALLVGIVLARSAGAASGWEGAHRQEIIDLKARAEGQASAGRLRDAHDTYDALRRLVNGRQMQDDDLQHAVDSATADGERVYHVLLAQMAEAARKASVPPSVAKPAPAHVPPPQAPAREPTTRPSAVAVAGKPSPPPPAPEPARPEPHPIPPDPKELTDAQIGATIQHSVDWLLDQFDPDTHILRNVDAKFDGARATGMDALAVYALLQCGQAINDPRLNVRGATMRAMLDALKKMPIDEPGPQNYARALRATCLALFDRPEDFPTLQDDADYLLGTCNDGAYTYSGVRRPKRGRTFGPTGKGWDNSNSQYGLLGVWSAIDAEPRIEVPTEYWRTVERHWIGCQNPDGQWGYYTGSNGRNTMTCAGIASLFVTHEYYDPRPVTNDAAVLRNYARMVGREPFRPELKKALNWFEQGNHSVDSSQSYWGYSLYGIERVGLASGFKRFGVHDWYRELAQPIVEHHDRPRSWGDPVETSYALLFLSRGRHPILMNKLRYDRRGEVAAAAETGAFWDNRPRDLANLARYAGRQLERPINWQIVSVEAPWTDWSDSPILYIASHEPPPLTDADIDKLRQFVESGGMIFTHADIGSPAFNNWARSLARRLFPRYELAELPVDSPIYNVVFKPTPRPPLQAVSNGARVLMVHSPGLPSPNRTDDDLAIHWQKRDDRAWETSTAPPHDGATRAPSATRHVIDTARRGEQLAPFQLGVNLFVYAAGKRDLRNRIDSTYVAPVAAKPLATVRIARLQYSGNWDPEPGAWVRYANVFQRQTGYKLDVQPMKLSDLTPGDARRIPIADLTGNFKYTFSAAEVAGLKAYVEGGGVVLMDVCGGMGPFEQDLRQLLGAAFPGKFPLTIEADHPLLSASGAGMDDIPRPRLRAYTVERLGNRVGTPALVSAGKGHVIATNMDLTCALLATNTWGIVGYDPSYAQSLVKNAIFWSLDGQPMTPTLRSPAPAPAPPDADRSASTPAEAAAK